MHFCDHLWFRVGFVKTDLGLVEAGVSSQAGDQPGFYRVIVISADESTSLAQFEVPNTPK